MTAPEVSVVLVSYGTRDLTLAALASLREAGEEVPLEAIVVDNASPDDSADAVAREHPWATLVREGENRGFAAGANRGAALARAPWLVFLNTDARLCPGALPALLAAARATPRPGALGPAIFRPDGRRELSAGRFFGPWRDFVQAFHLNRILPGVPGFEGVFLRRLPAVTTPVDWVSGACLLVARDAFESVGGFDEAYFLYVEDMDLCRSLREAGRENFVVPAARLLHEQGSSMPRENPVLLEGGDAPEYFAHKHRLRYPFPVQRALRIVQVASFVVLYEIRALGRRMGGRSVDAILPRRRQLRRTLVALLGLGPDGARLRTNRRRYRA